MKRILVSFLTLAFLFIGCGTKELKLEDIKALTLTIGRSGQKGQNVIIFEDPEKIKHFFAIEKKLVNYEPKEQVPCTRKLDIKFVYHLQDGTIIERSYKEIRFMDEHLKALYNSLESEEKQTIPLFKLIKGKIKKI